MKPMSKFIVIEGLDGSGKSTVTKLLAEHFNSKSLPTIITCEPTTNNPIGNLIQNIISGEVKNIDNETLALLFAADRHHHLANEIIPTLAHSHVICDRYYHSSMAYQGIDPASLKRVIAYNQTAMDIRRPDIVFFLNVSPDECIRRVKARNEEASIFETLPKLELRYERYMAAIEHMKKIDNIIIVGSDKASAEEIAAEMWSHIEGKL